MTSVPVRELRNDTAAVVRRVQNGEDVTITSNGHPVAELIPPRARREGWIGPVDLVFALGSAADSGLRDDLDALAGETTDELRPL
jgi:prevent-host-death family protein